MATATFSISMAPQKQLGKLHLVEQHVQMGFFLVGRCLTSKFLKHVFKLCWGKIRTDDHLVFELMIICLSRVSLLCMKASNFGRKNTHFRMIQIQVKFFVKTWTGEIAGITP